ncbi:MAG: trypsin-like peptidase domain-containing protein [Bacteroidota bacterium]
MRYWITVLLVALIGSVVGGLLTYQLLADNLSTAQSIAIAPSTTEAVRQMPVVNSTSYARSNSPSPTFDFTEAAQRVTPAVVHIRATVSSAGIDELKDMFEQPAPLRGGGKGSGVMYTSGGYVLTNHHVIAGTNRIEVTLTDNSRYDAEIVGFDEKTDIAVLKIEGEQFPVLELADSDQAEIGQWVLAIGNPLDLNATVTAGIISAKGRQLELIEGRDAIESFIQTDAAVNPGNSGGPLVDADGKLLGINTAIATRTGLFQGYSFAIPINLVRRIADDIIETGSFQRVFLGVEIYSLDAGEAENLNVDINQGVVIERVEDNSSAEIGGLLPGDIVVGVGEREVRSLPDLTEIIGRSRIGDVLPLRIYRQGEYVDIEVEMLPPEAEEEDE